MFINRKNKMSIKYSWRGTLYAAYPCIENMASFKYPFEKAVSEALWIIFRVKKYNACD